MHSVRRTALTSERGAGHLRHSKFPWLRDSADVRTRARTQDSQNRIAVAAGGGFSWFAGSFRFDLSFVGMLGLCL